MIMVYYIGSAEGHEYPDLQVGDEVNPRRFFSFQLIKHYFFRRESLGTLATGGATHLWLGCDKRWNCTVLAMAMVRSPTTSCWYPSIDTRYSVTDELKRIAS